MRKNKDADVVTSIETAEIDGTGKLIVMSL